jgi:glycosyltransferase involved in cell wall biosynthesis
VHTTELTDISKFIRRGLPGRREALTSPGVSRGIDRALERFLVPDVQLIWAVLALRPALGLISREKTDVIYSTSPPASAHLLALALKKISGRPWVMDLRDPWSFEPLKGTDVSRARMWLEGRMERACLGSADVVVVNTPEAAERYRALYPRMKGKIRVITNGYDPEETSIAAATADELTLPYGGRFLMSHIGALYRNTNAERTPEALLQAIKALGDEGRISAENFMMVFAGGVPLRMKERVSELSLDGLVCLSGQLSHLDALRLMHRSGALLLYDGNERGETYVHTKLYEYLASGKPVLGLLPEGATRRLLQRSGRGLMADCTDREAVKRAIIAVFEGHGPAVSGPGLDMSGYERKRLAGQLADCLYEALKGKVGSQ